VSDRKILIAVLRQHAHTTEAWSEHELGEVGEYGKRVKRTRLGSSRLHVLKIRRSSRCRVELLAATVNADSEAG
jgi:hypothetical protein